MEIEYLRDSGARHDWLCEHCDRRYVVSYHYQNRRWTVQLFRKDGEHQILTEEESRSILDAFRNERLVSPLGQAGWDAHIGSAINSQK